MYRSDTTLDRPRSPCSGFTVIELLVTIAVLVSVLLIGAPSVQGFMLDSRRTASGGDLVGALNYARGQALITKSPVTVCRSANPSQDKAACSGSGGWESGWIVFVDRDGDGKRGEDEPILRQHENLFAGTTLRGNSKVASRITFKATGMTANNGSFALCDSRGWNAGRVIIIAVTGRVRSASTADAVDVSLSSCTPSA